MLTATILALAVLLNRGPVPPPVVAAIAQACAEEAAAHPVDRDACAALVLTYASRESCYRVGVYGDSGRSYGLLQEPAAVARELDTLGQVRWWLGALRRGTLAGLDSSPLRAARREALAARLLQRVTESTDAPRQTTRHRTAL